MKISKLLGILVAGGLFGSGLAISGMTNPARVIGFLDVTGDWDPALAFVMAGAVATYGIGMRIVRRLDDEAGLPSCAGDSSSVNRKLVIGAAIFGVGWGLGGFCPGPALANLGAFRIEAIVFVPMMIIGMLIAQRGFGVDR